MIESTGAKAGTIEILVSERTAIKRIAKRLKINEGDPLASIERVRTADAARGVFRRSYRDENLKTPDGKEHPLKEIEDYLKINQSMYRLLIAKNEAGYSPCGCLDQSAIRR